MVERRTIDPKDVSFHIIGTRFPLIINFKSLLVEHGLKSSTRFC